MTHALADLLADRFDEEPDEIKLIKSYVQDNFDQAVAVAIRDQQLIITTRTAALAGALRPHLQTIKQFCGTNKHLILRIG